MTAPDIAENERSPKPEAIRRQRTTRVIACLTGAALAPSVLWVAYLTAVEFPHHPDPPGTTWCIPAFADPARQSVLNAEQTQWAVFCGAIMVGLICLFLSPIPLALRIILAVPYLLAMPVVLIQVSVAFALIVGGRYL